jgi:hypothetical protein
VLGELDLRGAASRALARPDQPGLHRAGGGDRQPRQASDVAGAQQRRVVGHSAAGVEALQRRGHDRLGVDAVALGVEVQYQTVTERRQRDRVDVID